MALTRVTRTVVASNLISSALIANNAIEGRHIADATLTVAHLDSQANALAVETRVNANLNQNHNVGWVTLQTMILKSVLGGGC